MANCEKNIEHNLTLNQQNEVLCQEASDLMTGLTGRSNSGA
jgi:hypothetical protein